MTMAGVGVAFIPPVAPRQSVDRKWLTLHPPGSDSGSEYGSSHWITVLPTQPSGSFHGVNSITAPLGEGSMEWGLGAVDKTDQDMNSSSISNPL